MLAKLKIKDMLNTENNNQRMKGRRKNIWKLDFIIIILKYQCL